MIDVAQNPSDAVEKALDLFGNDILRFAFSYMKNREDAEDVLQETLIRLMQAQPVFENEQKLKSWLLRVAANLCLVQLIYLRQRVQNNRTVRFCSRFLICRISTGV